MIVLVDRGANHDIAGSDELFLSRSDRKSHPPHNMDHSIDPIERPQLDSHFDELVDYIKSPIQTPHNPGFLMKINLKPKDLTICRNHDQVSIHTIFPDIMDVNIDVSQTQMIMRRNSFRPDVYPMTSGKHFVDT